MAKMKYYAVKVGRETGIFTAWSDCERQVKGYPNALYQSFKTKEEAEAYLSDDNEPKTLFTIDTSRPYAFVDGSYNPETEMFGFGYFIRLDEKRKYKGQGAKKNGFSSMRNVAGELYGVISLVKKLVKLQVPEIDLYYDYTGIEYWATGKWKANNELTQRYQRYMNELSQDIKINFIHVKAHSGVAQNEYVDALAKEAVGI